MRLPAKILSLSLASAAIAAAATPGIAAGTGVSLAAPAVAASDRDAPAPGVGLPPTGTVAVTRPDAGIAGSSEVRSLYDFRLPPSPRAAADRAGAAALLRARLMQPTVVPEPATWALMILGFGAVGAAMRRRRGRTLLRDAC